MRQAAGREATPSLACVDSQSVKGTACGGDHGIDGHKKINGVKRYILVDTMGLLLAVVVTAAAVTDARAAWEVFRRARAESWPRLVKVLGDHVYGNEGLPEWTVANTTFRLEISVKDPHLLSQGSGSAKSSSGVGSSSGPLPGWDASAAGPSCSRRAWTRMTRCSTGNTWSSSTKKTCKTCSGAT
ncbi:MAG: transposase [Gemmataceae bacterium]|nr:transposase [Gemmataceae bacterium]